MCEFRLAAQKWLPRTSSMDEKTPLLRLVTAPLSKNDLNLHKYELILNTSVSS